jgi:ATP-dependent RNA helicase DeaD
VIRAITSATGLDGEAIRNVRMLDRFAFLDVPAAEAERVVEQVDGSEVGGRPLRLEPVRG